MRKCISVFLLFLSCTTLVNANEPPTSGDRKHHIVYLGEKLSGVLPAAALHATMLSTVLGRDASKSILHNYKNFNGFVVKLTDAERKLISSAMKGIVSIFPSTKKHLHTTRSWDFMGFSQQVNRSRLESDIIVGVLDSGIWPESESFSDVGFGPPPLKWKGACEAPLNFTCNNKLIGARFYKSDSQFGPRDIQSPRDDHGHGTHTASTAAGGYVSSASLSGLALGTARGGVPSARIAAYKVCWNSGGCEDADILAAFDDAIDDGVDIISLSLGDPNGAKNYFEDSIAIGSFHAMKNGILTVASAGNSGPDYSTTSNVAPWFMSVAASSMDRTFLTSVGLGNNFVYNGVSINTFDLNGTMYPLIDGGDAPNIAGGFDSSQASLCVADSLDPSLVSGKIVLCDGPTTGQAALSAGAVGAIGNSFGPQDTAFSAAVPYSSLGQADAVAAYTYKILSSNPTATIFKSNEVNDSLAPYVVSFSSRGPNTITYNILKPDITAPGNHILAAWSPIAPLSGVEGDSRAVQFNIQSGTSMSCPHVSGVAAYIKSYYPSWSPAAIKSALMTTAIPMNTSTSVGLEFAYGAGHLNPLQVLDPGLVYDAGVNDYISFLCGQGYDAATLQLITFDSTTCSSIVSDTDLNVPSFAVAVNPSVPFSATFNRKVTNVGPAASTYQATIVAYTGMDIQVVPSTLSFSSQGETLSFVVTVQGTIGSGTMISNSLIWSDGVHNVRSPIVIYTVS